MWHEEGDSPGTASPETGSGHGGDDGGGKRKLTDQDRLQVSEPQFEMCPGFPFI